MTCPACFNNEADFKDWKGFAIKARQETTPCEDCSKQFEDQMKGEGRCNRDEVMVLFHHLPTSKIYPDYKLDE